MFLRVLTFLVIIIFFYSCNKFSFEKNKKTKVLDTVGYFSEVHSSPSFKECDSIINKKRKEDCFRKTIHLKIKEGLQKHTFTIKDSISETVFVDLLINTKGKITLDTIQLSEYTRTQLPNLYNIITFSIENLPVITPANKRGMRVTTKYRLPIKIELKE